LVDVPFAEITSGTLRHIVINTITSGTLRHIVINTITSGTLRHIVINTIKVNITTVKIVGPVAQSV